MKKILVNKVSHAIAEELSLNKEFEKIETVYSSGKIYTYKQGKLVDIKL